MIDMDMEYHDNDSLTYHRQTAAPNQYERKGEDQSDFCGYILLSDWDNVVY